MLGVFPDTMHIVYLAIVPDVLTSFLLDNTPTRNRDAELLEYWNSYRSWCESMRDLG